MKDDILPVSFRFGARVCKSIQKLYFGVFQGLCPVKAFSFAPLSFPKRRGNEVPWRLQEFTFWPPIIVPSSGRPADGPKAKGGKDSNRVQPECIPAKSPKSFSSRRQSGNRVEKKSFCEGAAGEKTGRFESLS
jgi:hypothetical protein